MIYSLGGRFAPAVRPTRRRWCPIGENAEITRHSKPEGTPTTSKEAKMAANGTHVGLSEDVPIQAAQSTPNVIEVLAAGTIDSRTPSGVRIPQRRSSIPGLSQRAARDTSAPVAFVSLPTMNAPTARATPDTAIAVSRTLARFTGPVRRCSQPRRARAYRATATLA
jgi:hypothetical protein